MKLYNCYTICKKTGIPVKYHKKLLEYMHLLGTKGSTVYNPLGYGILTNLFTAITLNQKKKMSMYFDLFAGYVETLIAQAFSFMPSGVPMDPSLMMDKAEMQEYLYDKLPNPGKTGGGMNRYRYVGDHSSDISVAGYFASVAVKAAVMHFIAAGGNAADTARTLTAELHSIRNMAHGMLLTQVISCLQEEVRNPTGGADGENFKLIINILVDKSVDKGLVSRAIKARNNAVHSSRSNSNAAADAVDLNVVGFFLTLLILGIDGHGAALDPWRIDVGRTAFWERFPGRVAATLVGTVLLCVISYLAFVLVSEWQGQTDIEKVDVYSPGGPGVEARYYEAVGQRDTATVLEIQRLLQITSEMLKNAKQK